MIPNRKHRIQCGCTNQSTPEKSSTDGAFSASKKLKEVSDRLYLDEASADLAILRHQPS